MVCSSLFVFISNQVLREQRLEKVGHSFFYSTLRIFSHSILCYAFDLSFYVVIVSIIMRIFLLLFKELGGQAESEDSPDEVGQNEDVDEAADGDVGGQGLGRAKHRRARQSDSDVGGSFESRKSRNRMEATGVCIACQSAEFSKIFRFKGMIRTVPYRDS